MFLCVSSHNTVSDNTCNYNRIGISLDGSDANTVTDNTCNYNRIGIYLSGSNANILSNNICLGNAEHDTLEQFVVIHPVVLLVGVVGIIMLGAGWRVAKLLRAGTSEIWIGG
jgi:parallel beta-helix repeat protein